MEVDVEDAGGVLGPLHVAADPIQRLRDAAQHEYDRPNRWRRCCCCCCWACDDTASPGPVSGGRRGANATSGAAEGTDAVVDVTEADGGPPPARTQVSLEPPPCDEFTTRLPSRR